MKNLLIALVMTVFFSVLGAALVFADEAKSENFSMPIAQTGASTKAPEKKELLSEEIAARIAAVEKALERDNDKLVKRFTHDSKTGVCNWSYPESEMLNWLTKNSDVIIDRKEYASPTYKITRVLKYDGKVSNECTTMIVVHYHKITNGGEGKK